MTGVSQSRIIRFGQFELDPQSGELRKNGVRLRLQQQPFQVLAELLANAGRIVTREELQRKLWPADTFVDFDVGLNTAIRKIRQTLDDDAEHPRYVETVAKRGYRFIAPVSPGDGSPAAVAVVNAAPLSTDTTADAELLPSSPPPRSRFRWLIVALMATAFLIACVLFALDAGGLRGKVWSHFAVQPQIHSLAVLPLANISGDPEQEYFADGMTEELITELSRIGSLKVISRTSVMQYKGEKKKPLPQIGRELNVDAVMEGSVLRSGNQVRIAAHMIYAPTDQNVMTETYERDLGDVLKLQREVAEAIAQQVRLKLTPEQQARLQQAREVNPEAFNAYLMATSFDSYRRQEIKKAQAYFERAIQNDPGFASAYVGRARCYRNLGQFRWLSPQDAYPQAKQAARRALELEEKNCNGHFQLAWLSWRYDWDWAAADKEFQYALDLCPNSASIREQHAYYSAWGGRGVEAHEEMAKSRELDPLFPAFLEGQALINFHLRNYKAMIEVGRSNVASNANSWLAHLLLGFGYEGSGQTREAIAEYQKSVELSEGNQDPVAALAHAYAGIGRRAEAQKILHEWQRQAETSYISPYMIATVYAGLGDKDRAFEFLEKAYQERSSDLPYFLKADLRIDNLRSDPRFQNLLRRMNFPQ